MNAHEMLSEDGFAVLALCSALGLKGEAAGDAAAPLKLSEWNEFAGKLDAANIAPASLLGKSAAELGQFPGLDPADAERIAQLLDRGHRLTMELERLRSLGIWAVTRVDEPYPSRMAKTLKHQAPAVLFGAGDIRLLSRSGVAVVGSRHIDEAGAAFAQEVGRRAARAQLAVVSGGAKGTDRIAMQGALDRDGVAVGAIADSLERTARQPDVQEYLVDGRLALVTPYAPDAGFSVGAAMGRNKLIYGLAEYAIVVSSDHQSGGTWAGAVEALKGNWGHVFARSGDAVPKGNQELVKLGATPLESDELDGIDNLREWLKTHSQPQPRQADLF